MAAELIPAVLGYRLDQLQRRVQVAQRLHPLIHLDIMDGRFVVTKSPNPAQLKKLRLSAAVECHLMVLHPQEWLETILRFRLKRVILPLELGVTLRPVIALFRARHIPVSLAISPRTALSRLAPWIRFIESVTVMGVVPGRYGAPAWPGTAARLRRLRQRWPKLKLAVDGGLSPEKISAYQPYRLQRFIVGSSILLAADPAAAYKTYKKLLTSHAR